MADQSQTPPPPGMEQAAPTASLKCVYVSGTGLWWRLGEDAGYTKADGTKVTNKVVGMFIAGQGPKPDGSPNFQVQIHIKFEDDYTDIFLVEDHLVIKNIEVGAIAVVKPTLLVPKGKR